MTSKSAKLPQILTALALVAFCSWASAKSEEWTDPLGNSFKGEADCVLGPLAIIKTGATTAKRIPLHFLSEEDSVRFDDLQKTGPQRASDWATARSKISAEIKGHMLKLENGKLVPADFAGKTEPEFYILFFVDSSVGGSWDMLSASMPKYIELQQQFPGMVSGVLFGLNHGKLAHKNMATSMVMPWLVTDYDDQPKLDTITQLMPKSAPLVLVLTRNGSVLFGTDESSPEKVGAVFSQLTDLIKLMQPGNAQSWADRLHYFSSIQRAKFKSGSTGPLLVGDPISPDALAKHGAKKFTAKVSVSAKGVVTAVALEPGYDVPEKIAAVIPTALKKAAFVPAIKDGEYVDDTYNYQFSAGQ